MGVYVNRQRPIACCSEKDVLVKTWRAAWSMKAVIGPGLSVTSVECNDIIMSAGEKMNVCKDCVRETRPSWEGKNNVIRDFSREPDALSTLIFKWCSANATLCVWALLNGYWCWLTEVLSLCPIVFPHLSFQIQKFSIVLYTDYVNLRSRLNIMLLRHL